MSRLDVVISCCDGVVAHVGGQSREKMWGQGIHVIGIICGVVALEAVSGIEQDDIVRSEGIPVFPDGRIDRVEGVFLPSVGVAGREPAAVHVCCGEYIKLILTVFQISAAGCCSQNCQCGCEVRFHFEYVVVYYAFIRCQLLRRERSSCVFSCSLRSAFVEFPGSGDGPG